MIKVKCKLQINIMSMNNQEEFTGHKVYKFTNCVLYIVYNAIVDLHKSGIGT